MPFDQCFRPARLAEKQDFHLLGQELNGLGLRLLNCSRVLFNLIYLEKGIMYIFVPGPHAESMQPNFSLSWPMKTLHRIKMQSNIITFTKHFRIGNSIEDLRALMQPGLHIVNIIIKTLSSPQSPRVPPDY